MIHSIIAPMLLGFALFMLGMKAMELALQRSIGKHLHLVLQRSTATPLHGLAVGTAATAVLQSSTAVTVMSMGLVNAGLLTFPRTLGIILGTNIGTCLTTELIGLNINRLAWPLLAAACGLWLVTALIGEMKLMPFRSANYSTNTGGAAGHRWFQPVRSGAVIIAGFALLLIGISVMQSIAPAVQSSGLFGTFLTRAEDSVLWGLAAGFVLTAAVHSSAAVIGIIMGLTSVGAMPVEIGIAVVIGANVGTCVTALLASLGGTKSGRFVAWSHTALNVGGAALFAPFVTELQAVSAWMSASPASQIAHAQTIFNIMSSLIALPLCYHPALKRLTPD